MVLLGSIVNGITIILGAVLGSLVKKGLPKRICDGVMQGIALCVLAIGIKGLFDGNNILISILSMAIGGALGYLLRLDEHLDRFGTFLQRKIGGKNNTNIGEGFVTATLLVCVGAMAITGALDGGIRGDHSTLYAKSLLDFISCCLMASTLGIGVALAGVACFLYQGLIALTGSVIAPYLTEAAIGEMTCVGSLLIMALALNMLGITKIKVINYIPACFLPILFCMVIK